MARKHARPLLFILSVLALSCTLVSPPPPATPEESAVQTRVAQGVAATLAAMPTATPPPPAPTLTPTPVPPTDAPAPPQPTATLYPLPTATPFPTPVPPTYVVEEERAIGRYTVRLWRNTADDAWGFDNIATISAGGQTLVQIEMVSRFGDLTGADITGEGHPDAIVETFTGGAHCCFSTIVYDLGPVLTKVMETPQSNCGGRFEDLDGDAVFEFVTCDDLFAYAYCPYAASPAVQAILRYEPGRGYVPVSPRFAHLYAEAIAVHTRMAEEAQPGELGEWDGTAKCAVLPLVLDYLYTGQADRAWAAFSRLYGYADRLLFWAEVVQAVADSPLYVPAGPQPAVSLPPHYMLQLLTNCGPDWQYVGFLEEGQWACGPAVPHRDIFWLEAELHSIRLLTEGERLELTPEGCTTNCRLDVVSLSDGARLGSIRLDTAIGFPGAVYRVDGVESAHWRLRGDLTWEQVGP
jgi:hypothetical protein